MFAASPAEPRELHIPLPLNHGAHRRTVAILERNDTPAACTSTRPKREGESENLQSEGEQKGKHRISRRLPAEADRILKQWLFAHVNHPFPNDDEKDELALCTGLTHKQINNYFINARRRFLKSWKQGTGKVK